MMMHMMMMGEDEATGGYNQRYQEYGYGDDQVNTAAAVVGSGSAGGVGTTSALLFNDGFEDDEGYIEASSNN